MDGSVHTVTPLSFQSTLSVRRATDADGQMAVELIISIHALREESDHSHAGKFAGRTISIHALREESDLRFRRDDLVCKISIHALREESDSVRAWYGPGRRYFNPRSP